MPAGAAFLDPQKLLREKVDNHRILVEKYPTFFLLPIIFGLFLHSQKRTLRLRE
jgi:hypothetical protein